MVVGRERGGGEVMVREAKQNGPLTHSLRLVHCSRLSLSRRHSTAAPTRRLRRPRIKGRPARTSKPPRLLARQERQGRARRSVGTRVDWTGGGFLGDRERDQGTTRKEDEATQAKNTEAGRGEGKEGSDGSTKVRGRLVIAITLGLDDTHKFWIEARK